MLAPLLLAAGLSFAAPDLCPINTPDYAKNRYVRDSAECAFLLDLAEKTRQLAAVAKLDPDRYALTDVDERDGYNAAFYTGRGRRKPHIAVTPGFVACHVHGDREGAYTVLAHELGHGVQYARGINVDYNDQSPEGLSRMRRNEAEADQLGWDMLHRAGLNIQPGYDEDALLRCSGGREYVARHSHPSSAVRWIEAMRHYEAPDGRTRRGAIRPAGQPLADLKARDVFQGSGWSKLDDQGRAPSVPAAAAAPASHLVSSGFLPVKDELVVLDDGVTWYLPDEYARYFTPAEIIAYATREKIKPKSLQQGAAEGLGYLRATKMWGLLPGVVRDHDTLTLPRGS